MAKPETPKTETPKPEGRTTISISKGTLEKLVKIQGKYMVEQGKKLSFDEILCTFLK